jgi:two-component system chemotaxis sensor kinase CheA
MDSFPHLSIDYAGESSAAGDSEQSSYESLGDTNTSPTSGPIATDGRSVSQEAGSRTIRVHADKLDLLIDQVGEMVIAAASSNLIAHRGGQADMMESTTVLARLVENIRDSVLQLRMVQIGETFDQCRRIAGKIAQEVAKDVELVITGADTELDKSVVEKLGDPLLHLVRHAIEHGIETAGLRAESGKPACGQVTLNAYHDTGSIVIEVSDDGGGLPLDALRNKAIEQGVIDAGAALSDQDIAMLIFEPGLMSEDRTAGAGLPGLGMDVVKKNITALRGTVEVRTEAARGSTFSIRLPLTLAIIDGFLVAVNDASYVIPLDNVVECLELGAKSTRGNVLNLRGEVLPFIRLRDFFDVDAPPPPRENVVVVNAMGHKAGIVVDQLLGEFQTVIKPLGNLFRHLHGIGGSTILGSGEVALILDVQSLTQLAAQHLDHSHAVAATDNLNSSVVSEKE